MKRLYIQVSASNGQETVLIVAKIKPRKNDITTLQDRKHKVGNELHEALQRCGFHCEEIEFKK